MNLQGVVARVVDISDAFDWPKQPMLSWTFVDVAGVSETAQSIFH